MNGRSSSRLRRARWSLLAGIWLILGVALAAGCGNTSDSDSGSGGASSSGGVAPHAAGGAASGGAGSRGDGGTTASGGTGSATGAAPSSDGGTPGAGASGGSTPVSGGGGASTGGDGGATEVCFTEPLALPDSSEPPRIALDEALPTPAGGTIVDGTYDRVDYVFYEDVDLDLLYPSRQVMRFKDGGTVAELAKSRPGDTELRASLTVQTSGSTLTLTATCPSTLGGLEEVSNYTATADSFWLFYEQLGTMPSVVKYQRR